MNTALHLFEESGGRFFADADADRSMDFPDQEAHLLKQAEKLEAEARALEERAEARRELARHMAACREVVVEFAKRGLHARPSFADEMLRDALEGEFDATALLSFALRYFMPVPADLMPSVPLGSCVFIPFGREEAA